MAKEKVQTTIYKTYTLKTKDRVALIPLKTRGGTGCSGRIGSSCSTSGICRVNLVANPGLVTKRVSEPTAILLFYFMEE